jgi:thiamine biosynthesis lipoprotein
MSSLTALYDRLGETRRTFGCCDTEFVVQVEGVRARAAVTAARQRVESLESKLDAFDPSSAVSRLNRDGTVVNEHVARIVRRGLAYHDRTDGVFDIRQGTTEKRLKRFLRGADDSAPERFETSTVEVNGDRVSADLPLDLNGLAKGYIVDRAGSALAGVGRRGFVSGGGDMSPPIGPVGIESPYDDSRLKTLDTDWSVATSGGYRRHRDGVDHVYDPTTETIGSRHDSVTVVARRDCMEADALATTLAASSLDDARSLAEQWPGLEVLIVHDGVFHTTDGFRAHVADT